MKKLWQKNWTLDSQVEVFETQTDLAFDHQLLQFDVAASYAHAVQLVKIKLLNQSELTKLKKGLQEILQLAAAGKFEMQFGEEDIHTKIENFLTENNGEVGKKIHTGRSRNDQVLTDLRLLTKTKILEIGKATLNCASAFTKFAQQYEWVAMPGYTHFQKAMPSSVGMWASAFAVGLLDSLTMLKSAYQLNDQSPLGSAAGYGVPLKLDRKLTADLLGFAEVQMNPMACQNSRGKIEAATLAALTTILFDINKFASDVLLFTTSEFNFFQVDLKICSGSSIMPQKKNVDLAELLRSKIHVVMGNYLQIVSLASNLPSGYNRDLQDSKKPFLESLELAWQSIQLTQLLLESLTPNLPQLSAAMTPELFATAHALKLLNQQLTFRDAYQQTATALVSGEIVVPANYLHSSTHLGGTGNLQLAQLQKKVQVATKIWQAQANYFHEHLEKIFMEIGGVV